MTEKKELGPIPRQENPSVIRQCPLQSVESSSRVAQREKGTSHEIGLSSHIPELVDIDTTRAAGEILEEAEMWRRERVWKLDRNPNLKKVVQGIEKYDTRGENYARRPMADRLADNSVHQP